MNEGVFLLHVAITGIAALVALRMGRGALIGWIGLQAVIANLFVIKQIQLFGMTVTSSDVYVIGSILSLNLLQEFHGKEAARASSHICLFLMVAFGIMSQMHLAYVPSPVDTTHAYFVEILGVTPRLLVASFVVFYIVQRLDIYLFGRLRDRLHRWPLALRSGISVSISQLADTVLFTYIGLWGLIEAPLEVIVVSYAIKLLVIAFATPFTALARKAEAYA